LDFRLAKYKKMLLVFLPAPFCGLFNACKVALLPALSLFCTDKNFVTAKEHPECLNLQKNNLKN
jgi:hypothetical protein